MKKEIKDLNKAVRRNNWRVALALAPEITEKKVIMPLVKKILDRGNLNPNMPYSHIRQGPIDKLNITV